MTGVSKGPRNQKKKGVIVETESRDEEENARQEEDNLMVEDQEEQNPDTQLEGNTSMFVEDMAPDDRSPIDFTTLLASSPPMRNMDFREPMLGERAAHGQPLLSVGLLKTVPVCMIGPKMSMCYLHEIS